MGLKRLIPHVLSLLLPINGGNMGGRLQTRVEAGTIGPCKCCQGNTCTGRLLTLCTRVSNGGYLLRGATGHCQWSQLRDNGPF